MTLLEQLEQQFKALPPEKQSEVVDFAAFLRQRATSGPHKPRSCAPNGIRLNERRFRHQHRN
ncbi:MAG: DUF2281 domain-containing protein [Chloroflexi bacterium]|nr:DUF2281 domain-containing protein [Chloroflexota bacterium]